MTDIDSGNPLFCLAVIPNYVVLLSRCRLHNTSVRFNVRYSIIHLLLYIIIIKKML